MDIWREMSILCLVNCCSRFWLHHCAVVFSSVGQCVGVIEVGLSQIVKVELLKHW